MTDFHTPISTSHLLLIDSDAKAVVNWQRAVARSPLTFHTSVVDSVVEARKLCETQHFKIVFADFSSEEEVDLRLLISEVRKRELIAYFVMITEDETVEMMQKATALSMDDFIAKGPLYTEEVLLHLGSFMEQDRLHHALELSGESYRDLFDIAPLPLFVVDSQSGNILRANESANRFLRPVGNELEETAFWDWFQNVDGSDVREWGIQAESREIVVVDPLTLRKPRSSSERLRARIRSFQFGRTQALQIMLEDVSQLKREAQSIDYVTVRETEAEKLAAVGQILSNVAHEINNPMSVIMGLSLLLTEDPSLQAHREDLEILQRSAERCNTVLQDILRFTKMQGISVENVELDRLLGGTVANFLPQCEAKGIRLESNLGCESVVISGDPFLLEHVLLAIFTNAQEAILRGERGGCIQISSEVKDKAVFVRISNDGPMIPLEIQRRVFDPFFTTKQKGEGVGLSMFYCYGVIKEHFGELELVSSDHDQTEFLFEIPILENGIVTALDSATLSRATAARPLIFYYDAPSATLANRLVESLNDNPSLETSLVLNEDDLLDQVASCQPDIVVLFLSDLSSAEALVSALRCLVFRTEVRVMLLTEKSSPIFLEIQVDWKGEIPGNEFEFYRRINEEDTV